MLVLQRGRRLRTRVRTGCSLACLTGAVLVACGTSALTIDQLKAVPDSHLRYPGASVVRVDAVPQTEAQTNAAPVDGFVATTLRTSASQAAVLLWYERRLASGRWAARGREAHGETNDGHAVPPAYLFTRGTQEVFALTFDPIAGDYITTYIALIDHCDTVPPYPLGAGDCGTGKPVS